MQRTTKLSWLGTGLVVVVGCAPAGGVKPAAAPAAAASTAAKLAPQISAAEAAKQAVAAVKQASIAYADAYNARDYAALAAQWTEKAELIEGGSRLEGRDAIVNSIRPGWAVIRRRNLRSKSPTSSPWPRRWLAWPA